MFDNVTCTGLNSSNTIFKAYFRDKFESCINGTEVHNVTSSEPGKIEQYCGKKSFIYLTGLSPTHFELCQDGLTFCTKYNLIGFFILLRAVYVLKTVSVRSLRHIDIRYNSRYGYRSNNFEFKFSGNFNFYN